MLQTICLTRCTECGVFIHTTLICQFLGDQFARKERQQALQGPGPLARGHFEFRTREGHRPKVPRKRVLRSARSGAGQVRDVASRLCRERAGDRRRRRVWGLQADVLSGQGKLRRSRDCGAGTQETRPSRPAQAPLRGVDVSRKPGSSGRADSSATAVYIDSTAVRSRGAPENDRARVGRKKNSKVNREITDKRPGEPPASIASRYETLRMAALGEPLPPEARSGLGVFLRRGMWAWVQALAVAREPAQTTSSPSSSLTAPYQYRGVIQVFAAMALNTNHRRAQ